MKAFFYILIAAVLFMAGLGASVTCTRAIKENDIMSMGRRYTTLIRKEKEPRLFWITVSFNGLIAIGLFGGSAALVFSAVRGSKKSSPTRR